MTTFVIAEDGTKLMPTTNVKKVRKLLRAGRAVICKHEPFTIKLCYETTKDVQDIEFNQDTGYLHIGNSVKSQKHEYVSEQRDSLFDEVEHHESCYKYRHTRRNRKTRYRKERRDNRKATKQKGWIAPSIEHKVDNHVNIFKMYYDVAPITRVTIETAQFDTQLLKAIEDGKPIPHGKDYQRGERYEYDTLREAVFSRDNYKCVCCGKSGIENGAILRTHHIGYWKKDRTNRMSNLATVCTKCHTHKNHKPGGKLYGLSPITKTFNGADFMNIAKDRIVERIQAIAPEIEVKTTNGVITKRTRNDMNIAKSHADDAYCMGDYRPKHRAKTQYYQKRRRNNRVLDKFYDAKIIDIRDGQKKSGADLSCGRTNRSESRNGPKNERIYRGKKVTKGHRAIRTQRYTIQPGTIFMYDGKKYISGGVQHYGEYVTARGLEKGVKTEKVAILRSPGGWSKVDKPKQKSNAKPTAKKGAE